MSADATDVVSTAIAAGALVVSVRVWWNEIWARRKAGLEVRWETYLVPHWSDMMKRPETKHRIVVVNHGPAVASDVELNVRTADDDAVILLVTRRQKLENDGVAIPPLHSGQRYDVQILPAEGITPASATIIWRDKRRARQSLRTDLSELQVVPALGIPHSRGGRG